MALMNSLANQLLIAMPSLDDPNFAKSVIYVCEHHEHGSVGLIVNRPMQYPLSIVFEQLQIEPIRVNASMLAPRVGHSITTPPAMGQRTR